jgi:hypothetical protein
MGGSVEEGELDDDEAEKVAAALLVHLVPEAARGEVGNAGKQRRPWRWSAGTASPASSKQEEAGDGNLSRRFPRFYLVG